MSISTCPGCTNPFEAMQGQRFCSDWCSNYFQRRYKRQRAAEELSIAAALAAVPQIDGPTHPYAYVCMMCGDSGTDRWLSDAQLSEQKPAYCGRCQGRMFLDRTDIGTQGAYDTTSPTRITTRQHTPVPTGRRA